MAFVKGQPAGPGRKRVPVRQIPCSECGAVFGQTANELERGDTQCPPCDRVHRESRNARRKKTKPAQRGTLEIVLPGIRNGFYDPKKEDWYMRVRVRKRKSDEPLKADRIYFNLGKHVTPEQVGAAVTATCARLEMSIGAVSVPQEIRAKRWEKKKVIIKRARSWSQGRDKDHGIEKRTVKRVIYKVALPDPLVDKKRRLFGSYDTRAEARVVRRQHYLELEKQLVPCAVCGKMPHFKGALLTHFTGECQNRVQFPKCMRKLFQTKLWNLVLSEGKYPNAEKLTGDDLYAMGYMKMGPKGNCFGRVDVEYDFTLAKTYLRNLPPIEEEEIGFE